MIEELLLEDYNEAVAVIRTLIHPNEQYEYCLSLISNFRKKWSLAEEAPEVKLLKAELNKKLKEKDDTNCPTH